MIPVTAVETFKQECWQLQDLLWSVIWTDIPLPQMFLFRRPGVMPVGYPAKLPINYTWAQFHSQEDAILNGVITMAYK